MDRPGVQGQQGLLLELRILKSLVVLAHINKTHWKSVSSCPGSRERYSAGTSKAVN